MSLSYLIFDASDDGKDIGTWYAMANVHAADVPAVLAKVQVMMAAAQTGATGPSGPLDDGGARDADEQVQTDVEWTTAKLTVLKPAPI